MPAKDSAAVLLAWARSMLPQFSDSDRKELAARLRTMADELERGETPDL